MGGQRIDGLFGALIVKRRTERQLIIDEDIKDNNFIMHAGDWYHKRASLVSVCKKVSET